MAETSSVATNSHTSEAMMKDDTSTPAIAVDDNSNLFYFTCITERNEEKMIQQLEQLVLQFKNNSNDESLKQRFQQFLLEMCWLLFYNPSNEQFTFTVESFISILQKTRELTYRLVISDNVMVDDENTTTTTAIEYTNHWPFPDASLVILDVVSIFEGQYSEVQKSGEPKDDREKLVVSLLRELLNNSFVTLNEMKVYLSTNSLSYSDLFPSTFNHSRYIKLRTRMFYQQKRYNMFNEETEGYSKLVTEMLACPFTNEQSIAVLKERIQSLIGYFDLDPNRVFDLVLEAAEIFYPNSAYYDLISLFNKSNTGHILGFKFRFYHGKETPGSLVKCAAALIKNKYITIEDLYPHLYPEDDFASSQTEYEFLDRKRKEAQEAGSVNLMTDDQEAKKIDPREDKEVPENFINNQKLLLIVELLNLNAYDDALALIDSLSSTLSVAVDRNISSAMSRAITRLIEPIYSRLSPKNILSDNYSSSFTLASEEYELLSSIVFPLVYHLGTELCHDLMLFTRLVRVVKEYMTYFDKINPTENNPNYMPMLEVFLAGLCFVPMNPGLVYEIWDLFYKLSFERRFSIYRLVKQNGYEENYKLLAQYHLSGKDMKAFLRRLSKDNTKTRGRFLARIAHSNPLVVCEKICEQAERYENQITVLVDVLRYVSPLLHDIMSFCLMDRLTLPNRFRLKDDASTIASWLSNLATFSGHLFKKYSSIDLEPLINYVVNRIQEGGWEDLLIVRELVQHMSGIEIIDDTVSPQQLEAHAGGDTLRADAGGFSNSSSIVPRSLKRSMVKLKDTLIESGKGRMLLLLLAKLRCCVATLHDESELPDNHLRLVTDSLDKCHEAFCSLLRFFERNVSFSIEGANSEAKSPSKNTLSVPNLSKLISYGIDPELAFSIVRKGLTFVPRRADRDITISREDKIQNEIGDITTCIAEEKLWKVVSKELYITFWSLDLYDIYVPTQLYLDRIELLSKDVEEMRPQNKKKDQLESVIAKLKEELRVQTENNQKVLEYFRVLKDSFFDQSNSEMIQNAKTAFMLQFCQYCVLPRCMMSSTDALYCAKFVELLHMEEAPVFNTLQYLVRVISSFVPSYLVCATEQEAHRVAVMLRYSFEMVDKWVQSEEVFKASCDKPGFRRFIDKEPENRIQLKEFQTKILTKVHDISTEKYLYLLNSDNFNQVRCGLIVLTNLGHNRVFPKYRKHVALLKEPVERLKKEKVENIKVLALRYHAILMSLESTLPPQIEEPVAPPTPTPVVTTPIATPTKELREPTTPTTPVPKSAEKPAPPKEKSVEEQSPRQPSPPPKEKPSRGSKRDDSFAQPTPPQKKRSPSPAPTVSSQESTPPPPPVSAEEIRKKLLEAKSKKDKNPSDDSSESGRSRDHRDSSKSRDVRSSPKESPRRDDRKSKNRNRESRERDNRDNRDNRDRDSRDNKDSRDNRDNRDSRDNRENRETRDNRDRDNRDSRENKDNRDNRDRDSRDNRDSRDTRDNRDTRDSRDNRDNRENRDNRDSRENNRDSRDNRDNRGKRFDNRDNNRDNGSNNRDESRQREKDNNRDYRRDSRGNDNRERNERKEKNNNKSDYRGDQEKGSSSDRGTKRERDNKSPQSDREPKRRKSDRQDRPPSPPANPPPPVTTPPATDTSSPHRSSNDNNNSGGSGSDSRDKKKKSKRFNRLPTSYPSDNGTTSGGK